jgi:predicted nucleic acid-binding protein
VPHVDDRLRYVESSALLAALLEHDRAALSALRKKARLITSALTVAEASRVIVRARVDGRLTAARQGSAVRALQRFERRAAIVTIGDHILRRLGRPFPVEPVRTLDAIHLATIELLGEPPDRITVITRDARVRDNAMAMGYVVE